MVCEHNVKDISGLASIFLCLTEIAAAPIESQRKYRFNMEALALAWRKQLKRAPSFFGDEERLLAKTGTLLMEDAAKSGGARAALVMAKDAEWRRGDPFLACAYTEAALAAANISEAFRNDLEKRRIRLKGKIKRPSTGEKTLPEKKALPVLQ